MKRISSKEFPQEREKLIIMIRWLLNEMEYTHTCLEENNLDEAKSTLKKEIEEDFWLKFSQ